LLNSNRALIIFVSRSLADFARDPGSAIPVCPPLLDFPDGLAEFWRRPCAPCDGSEPRTGTLLPGFTALAPQLRLTFQKLIGFPEISCGKAFREGFVDWSEQVAPFSCVSLIAP
jgi:hypothetical protein